MQIESCMPNCIHLMPYIFHQCNFEDLKAAFKTLKSGISDTWRLAHWLQDIWSPTQVTPDNLTPKRVTPGHLTSNMWPGDIWPRVHRKKIQ